MRLRRADGEFRWYRVRGEPLRDREGRIIQWYGLSVDIDEAKKAEDRLRRSESYLAEAQLELAYANRVATMGELTCLDHQTSSLAGTLTLYGETQWDHYGRCRLSVCARQRDLGYVALSASVAIGRPCAPSQARTMPASCALLGHDELLPLFRLRRGRLRSACLTARSPRTP